MVGVDFVTDVALGEFAMANYFCKLVDAGNRFACLALVVVATCSAALLTQSTSSSFAELQTLAEHRVECLPGVESHCLRRHQQSGPRLRSNCLAVKPRVVGGAVVACRDITGHRLANGLRAPLKC